MVRSISEYKSAALSTLSGNWGSAILIMFVYYLFQFFVNFIVGIIFTLFFVTVTISFGVYGGYVVHISQKIISTFIFVPFAFGISMSFLDFVRFHDCKALSIERAVSEGYSKTLVAILRVVYIILWAFLFFIPGVIKAYSYIMTQYIVKDNPGIRANAAIDMSRSMMRGHKWKMFLVHLYICWWCILAFIILGIIAFFCVLSFVYDGAGTGNIVVLFLLGGLGFALCLVCGFYIMPIIESAQALFYEDLLEEQRASAPSATSSSDMKF